MSWHDFRRLSGSGIVDQRVVRGAFGVLWLWAFRGCQGQPHWCYGSGVVASLVWDLLRRVVLAEGAAASTTFGAIVLGLVGRLYGGVVLVSFLLGDVHGGFSKYLMFGILPWGFLAEAGYRSSVTAVWFCTSGGPADWVWGSCTRGCGGSRVFGWGCLPWRIFDWGGWGFWLVVSVGAVLAF